MKNLFSYHFVGLGFVGLTTALAFSEKIKEINAIETDKKKLYKIKNGEIPFFEPVLPKILKKNKKKINFSSNLMLEKNKINIVFLSVGTPQSKNGKINLTYVENFCKEIKKKYYKYKIYLFIKSTVIPGTVRNLKKKFFKNNKNIILISNPEFLREGYAWYDTKNAEKIVIGCDNKECFKNLKSIFKIFKNKKYYTSSSEAEFIKYSSNIFLSNLISLSNCLMMIGEKIGDINIHKVFKIVKKDNRWSGFPAKMNSYFHPGIGYGGYCLPKDTEAFYFQNKNNFIKEIIATNKKVLKYQVNKILKEAKKFESIVFLGVSFKSGTDDIRDSKPIEIIKSVISKTRKNFEIIDPLVSEININRKKIKILRSFKFKKNKLYVLLNDNKKYPRFFSDNKKNILNLRYSF